MNLGLNPFFRYYVVFDVAQGNVGVASCTFGPASIAAIPVLSTWAMGLLAAGLALIGALAITLRAPRNLERNRP